MINHVKGIESSRCLVLKPMLGEVLQALGKVKPYAVCISYCLSVDMPPDLHPEDAVRARTDPWLSNPIGSSPATCPLLGAP